MEYDPAFPTDEIDEDVDNSFDLTAIPLPTSKKKSKRHHKLMKIPLPQSETVAKVYDDGPPSPDSSSLLPSSSQLPLKFNIMKANNFKPAIEEEAHVFENLEPKAEVKAIKMVPKKPRVATLPTGVIVKSADSIMEPKVVTELFLPPKTNINEGDISTFISNPSLLAALNQQNLMNSYALMNMGYIIPQKLRSAQMISQPLVANPTVAAQGQKRAEEERAKNKGKSPQSDERSNFDNISPNNNNITALDKMNDDNKLRGRSGSKTRSDDIHTVTSKYSRSKSREFCHSSISNNRQKSSSRQGRSNSRKVGSSNKKERSGSIKVRSTSRRRISGSRKRRSTSGKLINTNRRPRDISHISRDTNRNQRAIIRKSRDTSRKSYDANRKLRDSSRKSRSNSNRKILEPIKLRSVSRKGRSTSWKSNSSCENAVVIDNTEINKDSITANVIQCSRSTSRKARSISINTMSPRRHIPSSNRNVNRTSKKLRSNSWKSKSSNENIIYKNNEMISDTKNIISINKNSRSVSREIISTSKHSNSVIKRLNSKSGSRTSTSRKARYLKSKSRNLVDDKSKSRSIERHPKSFRLESSNVRSKSRRQDSTNLRRKSASRSTNDRPFNRYNTPVKSAQNRSMGKRQKSRSRNSNSPLKNNQHIRCDISQSNKGHRSDKKSVSPFKHSNRYNSPGPYRPPNRQYSPVHERQSDRRISPSSRRRLGSPKYRQNMPKSRNRSITPSRYRQVKGRYNSPGQIRRKRSTSKRKASPYRYRQHNSPGMYKKLQSQQQRPQTNRFESPIRDVSRNRRSTSRSRYTNQMINKRHLSPMRDNKYRRRSHDKNTRRSRSMDYPKDKRRNNDTPDSTNKNTDVKECWANDSDSGTSEVIFDNKQVLGDIKEIQNDSRNEEKIIVTSSNILSSPEKMEKTEDSTVTSTVDETKHDYHYTKDETISISSDDTEIQLANTIVLENSAKKALEVNTSESKDKLHNKTSSANIKKNFNLQEKKIKIKKEESKSDSEDTDSNDTEDTTTSSDKSSNTNSNSVDSRTLKNSDKTLIKSKLSKRRSSSSYYEDTIRKMRRCSNSSSTLNKVNEKHNSTKASKTLRNNSSSSESIHDKKIETKKYVERRKVCDESDKRCHKRNSSPKNRRIDSDNTSERVPNKDSKRYKDIKYKQSRSRSNSIDHRRKSVRRSKIDEKSNREKERIRKYFNKERKHSESSDVSGKRRILSKDNVQKLKASKMIRDDSKSNRSIQKSKKVWKSSDNSEFSADEDIFKMKNDKLKRKVSTCDSMPSDNLPASYQESKQPRRRDRSSESGRIFKASRRSRRS